ncbi:hypothetical protein GXN76_12060 [Kroppenstedtia pulmonis]|uniref:Uncharacterized protein n=1 Tax=Kroppenstedtia pulmonis TaxID=1380685 RepID=A0A7D3XNT9_9BACL|nr:hypothetical protein [Kroppenstedtia pulmonis]QKG85129.1 hypothetical protein GXN76_12060 [Kroppenstedtia pulmonis]
MRVFPHGNVVNFNASVREMTPPELERLLKKVMGESNSILTGAIHMDRGEVYVYGKVEDVSLNTSENAFIMTARTEEEQIHSSRFSLDDLWVSHEMYFDIEDPSSGVVRYPVFYVTFNQRGETEEEEVTLFFADDTRVSNPLDCVVEFWNQAGDVGKETQFISPGCSVSTDFKSKMNRE